MDPITARRIELCVVLGYTVVGIGLSISTVIRVYKELGEMNNLGVVLVEEAEAYLGPREA